MVSNGGAIITEVPLWETDEELDRIFEETDTGLDMEDWIEMRNEEVDLDETWTF